jgi:hypothetical protein
MGLRQILEIGVELARGEAGDQLDPFARIDEAGSRLARKGQPPVLRTPV